ncbi:MAG: aminodeoxychorismate synthase component I [Alphaproteobacteria bacterium]|nr:aminodeoxychorismate synthase component I [Alphaproteobacteria bacterium]
MAPRTAFFPPKLERDRDDVLIVREVPWQDPLVAFTPFADDPVAALLHGDGENEMGRWSYIAASPFSTLTVDADLKSFVDNNPVAGDAFDVLQDLLNRYRTTATNTPAPFYSGAVGFFGYELGRLVENLPAPRLGVTNPTMVVGLYDVVAAFDHIDKKAWVMATGFPEADVDRRTARAHSRAQWLIDQISDASPALLNTTESKWSSDRTRDDIECAILNTIEYINAGDIFQANITQRHTAERPPDVTAWDLFRRLRQTVSSPFGAYVAGNPTFQVLSASPERFLHVTKKGDVETRPIKGTRPRHTNPVADAALADELTNSEKDLAENLMIVDLMRNDISRVCDAGSVSVPQHCALETFARVHHLVSVVTGKLRPEKTAVDLLRACFPGGSVTGAPKVRAMEIIHHQEPVARGPYCGAIGWIGFDGAMDTSIVIRNLTVDGDSVIAQAGGGIVADSDPALEYEEAMVKIRPLLSVLDPTALA